MHTYDIPHGSAIGELKAPFEKYAEKNYHPTAMSIVTAATPTKNYDKMKDKTLDLTQDSYWRRYWRASSGQYYLTNGYGPYDGEYGPDTFPLENCPAREANLVSELLGLAAGYTAGALQKISEKLPPIIENESFKIQPSLSKFPVKQKISLKIHENLSQIVTVYLTLDSITGKAINGFPKNYTLKSGSKLPWKLTIEEDWDGKLADGNYPDPGKHSLYLRVKDPDGNWSDADVDGNITEDYKADFQLYGELEVQVQKYDSKNKIVGAIKTGVTITGQSTGVSYSAGKSTGIYGKAGICVFNKVPQGKYKVSALKNNQTVVVTPNKRVQVTLGP